MTSCYCCGRDFTFKSKLTDHHKHNSRCSPNANYILDNFEMLEEGQSKLILFKLLNLHLKDQKTIESNKLDSNKIQCQHCFKIIVKKNMKRHLGVCKHLKKKDESKFATKKEFIVTTKIITAVIKYFNNNNNWKNKIKCLIDILKIVFSNTRNMNLMKHGSEMYYLYTNDKTKILMDLGDLLKMIHRTIENIIVPHIYEDDDHRSFIDDNIDNKSNYKASFLNFIDDTDIYYETLTSKKMNREGSTNVTHIKLFINTQIMKNKKVMQQYFLNHKY